MSIYYSGSFSRSAGIISAITKQLNAVNLKPVKKIEVKFDPFHPNAVTARDFLFHITNPKVSETNLNCLIKPIVVCDRSEPEIVLHLKEAGRIKFLSNNLNVLEILTEINKHVSSKVEPEELPTATTAKLIKKQRRK